MNTRFQDAELRMPVFYAPAFCGQSGRQVPVEDVLSRGLADRPGGHGDGGGGVGVGEEEEEEEEEEEVLSVGLVGVKWRRRRTGRDEAWSMDTCALGQAVTNCRCSRRRRRRRRRTRKGPSLHLFAVQAAREVSSSCRLFP